MAKMRRFVPLLMTLLILGLLSVTGVMWLQVKMVQTFDVPHAIYATGGLIEACHQIKARTGSWPPPGGYAGRDVEFVRSFDEKGTRVDVWDFGRGQFALFYFHEDSIQVLPVRNPPPAPPPSPSPPPATTTAATRDAPQPS
jgi:hypothetical protein